MEITTAPLRIDGYLGAVERLMLLMADESILRVDVCYGFGCDCPDDQLYEEVAMPVSEVPAFITRSVEAGYYHMGRDNLHINDVGGRVKVLLCHEADIHITSDDDGLCERLALGLNVSRAGGP